MREALGGAPSQASVATTWRLCALVALVGWCPSIAAERLVICEEFTDKYCFGCALAGPALSRLVDVYPDSFAFVQYHPYDEQPLPWAIERFAFYDGLYTPAAAFDGFDRLVGSLPDVDQQYVVYRTNHFLPERAVATDVTLQFTVEYLGGYDYRVSTEVGIEPAGTGKTLRIYVLQVLDYWPPDRPYHRNGFKQAAPTADVTLSPGQFQVVDNKLTLDEESWTDIANVKFIAWAQEPEAVYPAPVYQAVMRIWPLVTTPGDDDGDGVPDAADNCPHRFNPGQADSDGDGIGDACDNCPAVPNPDQANGDEDLAGDVCDNCPIIHSVDPNDNDGDGAGNPCDACPDVPAPAGIDAFGKSLGCIDLDCDVDSSDFQLFAQALAGPGITTPPPGSDPEHFARADVDGDEDVDLTDFAKVQVNFTGPLESPPLYVGVANCVSCHTTEHSLWLGTKHATAFSTLVNGGNGDNQLCFPCHSVGYGSPGGFIDLATTPQLADVQCEVCHGPGSNHVADPNNVPLVNVLDSAQCGSCHQSCHGLCGENHHPQYEEWITSKHAAALFDMQWLPETTEECLPCHSTEYRLAPPDQKPGVYDVTYNLECVTCHNPHGSANIGQLRLPPNQLCADCHTMTGALPGQIPKQPQTETLHGIGGYRLDGTPIYGPYSAHWWDIPTECVQCHVHAEPSGGPHQPSIAGHTFREHMRACLPCHTESVATLLVATMREEIDVRLATIAHYFDPNDPLYLDPGTLEPDQLIQYMYAQFDYDLVVHDRSRGSHNPAYLRALLSEAEVFFGIPPWEMRRATGGDEQLMPGQPAREVR